jgi:hypothetical protein
LHLGHTFSLVIKWQFVHAFSLIPVTSVLCYFFLCFLLFSFLALLLFLLPPA